MRKLWIVVGGLVCIALVVALWRSSLFYSVEHFSGDATARDSGRVFGLQRYTFRFREVPLAEIGETRLTCRGLPPLELFFGLECVGTHHTYFESLETRIGAKIVDEDGIVVLEYPSRLIGKWEACRTAESVTFYQSPSEFRSDTTKMYQVIVNISDAELNKARGVSVTPIMWGGGIETP